MSKRIVRLIRTTTTTEIVDIEVDGTGAGVRKQVAAFIDGDDSIENLADAFEEATEAKATTVDVDSDGWGIMAVMPIGSALLGNPSDPVVLADLDTTPRV